MSRRIALQLLWFCFSLWAAACGEPAPGAPADPLGSMPAEHVSLLCQKALGCCNASEQSSVLGLLPAPTTQGECEARLGALLAASFDEKRAAIGAGRLVFHSDRSSACFGQAESVSCIDFFDMKFLETNADCLASFEGRAAIGADCSADAECKDAAICDLSAGEAIGVCANLAGEGEACVDGRCQSGLFCRFAMAGGSLICRAPGAMGEACSLDLDCASGYCKAPENTCQNPAQVGEACTTNLGCVSGYCDTALGLCAEKKANGASCATNTECASGYCDDITASGLCAERKAMGAPCTVGGECQSGVCEQNACAAPPSAVICDGQ